MGDFGRQTHEEIRPVTWVISVDRHTKKGPVTAAVISVDRRMKRQLRG